jgi:hypothetical protein
MPIKTLELSKRESAGGNSEYQRFRASQQPTLQYRHSRFAFGEEPRRGQTLMLDLRLSIATGCSARCSCIVTMMRWKKDEPRTMNGVRVGNAQNQIAWSVILFMF